MRQILKANGAEVALSEATPASRAAVCEQIASSRGYHMVHACDDPDVTAGQATVALEFLQQVSRCFNKLLPFLLICNI